MIPRLGPRDSCFERGCHGFPIRGFLLLLMISSTGIFLTSVWKLHVVSRTGSGGGSAYSFTDISRYSDVVQGLPGLEGLRIELTQVIRAENQALRRDILERIQALAADRDPGAGALKSPVDTGTGLDTQDSDIQARWNASRDGVVRGRQNLTQAFWGRYWRETLEMDDDARAYLTTYEVTCQANDSRANMEARGITVDGTLPICPCIPSTLEGRHVPEAEVLLSLTWADTQPLERSVLIGGYWKPRDCIARRRLAVIIPCRDREMQLRAFLVHMHPLLQRQLIKYRIFVIEQTWPVIYNKASSMNAGFLEATSTYTFDCVMFHDVDLLAEDDRSIITCGDNPLHYGAHLDKWNYNVGYARIFGGAVSLTPDQFVKSNGYSNLYFGWGGEDDEFDKRVRTAGYTIARPPPAVSKHTALMHARDQANPVNPSSGRGFHNLPNEYVKEGLNTVDYEATDVILEPLFTWIKIRLKLTPDKAAKLGHTAYNYFQVRGTCLAEPGVQVDVLDEMSLSLISCRHECDVQPKCKALIYDESAEHHCVTLASLCKVNKRARGVTVHVKAGNDSDANYTMVPGDCHGKDIAGYDVGLKECFRACDIRPDCQSFVFGQVLSKPCWLKNEICLQLTPSNLGVKYYMKINRNSTVS